MIVSGWGMDIQVGTDRHRYLWAVRQECLDIDQCPAYDGDPSVVLCVGDSTVPQNSACHGDSGGNENYTKNTCSGSRSS